MGYLKYLTLCFSLSVFYCCGADHEDKDSTRYSAPTATSSQNSANASPVQDKEIDKAGQVEVQKTDTAAEPPRTDQKSQTAESEQTQQTARGNDQTLGPSDDSCPPDSGSCSTDCADKKVIARCLEVFGNNPFGDPATVPYRKIDASVQVLGMGNGIVDDTATSAPALILISAAVNVLGDTTYRLMNPNGWYCLNVGVNVMANTKVQLHCSAHLADSRVDVSVLKNGSPAGIVGVNVGSDVQVEKVSCP
ncbi:MAG: hypothetical protein HQK54_06870 [Oligoflexales bacterium]|nr:hypothetical protein [Oligoflexales bacterium]